MGSREGRETAYSVSDIEVLRWHESVRRRPGAYLESADPGTWATRLVQESLCHAVEELLEGHATHVILTVASNGAFSVSDDGRGWPGSRAAGMEVSALEVVVTSLHAGCRAMHDVQWVRENICKGSLAAVNALCERFVVTTSVDGVTWRLACSRGEMLAAPVVVETSRVQGLLIEASPDRSVVAAPIDVDAVRRWWRALPIDVAEDALVIRS